MPIPVVCACSAKLKVGDHLKGKHVKCPKCGAVLPVGGANGSAAAAAAPPAAPPTTAAVLRQSDLSDREQELLESRLERGERVVWAGKPAERVAFLRAWLLTFAWLFAAGVIITILVLMGQDGGFRGAVGLVILIALGAVAAGFLGLAFGWPFWARRRARRTFYAITTQRALGWYCGLVGRVSLMVFEPAAVAGVHRLAITGGPDGVGHLIFGARVITRRVGDGTYQRIERYGFFNVPRAAEVERVLRETLVDPFLEKVYD
jgi:hypothetical protein